MFSKHYIKKNIKNITKFQFNEQLIYIDKNIGQHYF